MQRREFITLLGGTVATWPLAARAAMPVIRFLRSTSIESSMHLVTAFRQGLKEAGYSEGQNVVIEYRSAEGQYDRLTELATDLVRRRVEVIVATGGPGLALAAKSATSTIPIIFTSPDPVKAGLVASLNQPGGNATGVSTLSTDLGSKRLGLLHELAPNATTIAVLNNPKSPDVADYLQDVQSAARSLGLQMRVLNAVNEGRLRVTATGRASRRISRQCVRGHRNPHQPQKEGPHGQPRRKQMEPARVSARSHSGRDGGHSRPEIRVGGR